MSKIIPSNCRVCECELHKRKSKHGNICLKCSQKEYYLKHSDKIKQNSKKSDLKCREQRRQYPKFTKCHQCEVEFWTLYPAKFCSDVCRDKRAIQQGNSSYQKHKDVILERLRQRRKEFQSKHGYSYNTGYRRRSINEQIAHSLRVRLTIALKGESKTKTTQALLGCNWDQLRAHLESLFLPGMTWENYGRFGWHIDHIITLSAFDLSDGVQLKKASNYMNLQPLWREDNLAKSNKF